MAQYTREQIRNFIRCPQLGSTDYGEWGALRLEQRLAINDLLDQLDSADTYIEKLGEENKNLDNLAKTMMNNYTKALEDTVKHDYIPKSVIMEKLEKVETDLSDVSVMKAKAKTQEVGTIYWSLAIRLDEKIKTLKELLGDEL